MSVQLNKSEVYQEDLNRIPPVDFSFRKIDTLQGMPSNIKPRGGRVNAVPNRGPKRNFITAGVWLNNNHLNSTEYLHEMIVNTLEYPYRLAWLDLSFNKIDTITEDIIKFPNLKILYLHGNNIQDLQAVMIMRPLTALRTLTLHGNPIDSIPSYRAYVVKIITQLVNLDFATIAPRERDAPLPPGLADILLMPENSLLKKSMKLPASAKPEENKQNEEPKQEVPKEPKAEEHKQES